MPENPFEDREVHASPVSTTGEIEPLTAQRLRELDQQYGRADSLPDDSSEARGNRRVIIFITIVVGCLLGVIVTYVASTAARIASFELSLFALAPLFSLITVTVCLRIVRGSLKDAERASQARLALPVDPDNRISGQMTPGEKILRQAPEHPIVLTKWYVAGFVIAYGGIGLSVFTPADGYAFIPLVAFAIIFGFRIWYWHRQMIYITNKRISMIIGLFNTKYPLMPLSKMTDQSLEISWVSNLFGYLRWSRTRWGKFTLESAGQEQAITRIVAVADAMAVNQMLLAHVL